MAELVDFFLDVFKGCADDDDVEEDEDVDNEDLSLLSRADDNNGEDGCEEVDVVYAWLDEVEVKRYRWKWGNILLPAPPFILW